MKQEKDMICMDRTTGRGIIAAKPPGCGDCKTAKELGFERS